MATFTIFFSALLVISLILQNTNGIKWLALGKKSISWDGRARHRQCGVIKRELGLTRGQFKICQENVEMMPLISSAAKEAMLSCQHIFQTRRWNCSNVLLTPNYTPDLTTGTREQAFVYALGSASLSYVLSKACAAGDLFNCSCSVMHKDLPHSGFKWGGCSENIQWASKFAKKFIDSSEKRHLKIKGSQKMKRGSVTPAADLGVVMMGSSSISRVLSKPQIAQVNLHNTRAGRKVLERALKTLCTCHGVSGSCSVKTCWKGLPTFLEVGEKLQNKYNEAFEVSVRSLVLQKEMEPVRKNAKSITGEDLVYVTKSPDYCLRDDRTGSLGTRGRYCNESSKEYDSCDIMCCGRGHTTFTINSIEMCHCKFRWCCDVVCKRCAKSEEKNICE